jgi:ribosome-associated protein
MEYKLSKSEKKRRAKMVEQLARELVALSPAEIKKLDCAAELKEDIREAGRLKGGARKRLTKYITKVLRQENCDPLLDFLKDRKGSRLKNKRDFRELEQLRDDIISDTIQALREAQSFDENLAYDWVAPTVKIALEKLPGLDKDALMKSARRYSRTRKTSHSREIFRTLKAAAEELRFTKAE